MAYSADRFGRMTHPQNEILYVIAYADGRRLECASMAGAEVILGREYPDARMVRRNPAYLECVDLDECASPADARCVVATVKRA